MAKKTTLKTVEQTPAELIAAWLKTNKPTVCGINETTPREAQGTGWGRRKKTTKTH